VSLMRLFPNIGVVSAIRGTEQRVRHTLAGPAERALMGSIQLALGSPVAARAADAVIATPIVDAIARSLARHHVLERTAQPLLENDSLDDLVARVLESGMLDEVIARLLESEELWILVDEVARSPAVTDAISHQSAGLADEVAGVVRDRSRTADARLERAARRLVHRPLPT
jgi:hypothetical protein